MEALDDVFLILLLVAIFSAYVGALLMGGKVRSLPQTVRRLMPMQY